MYLYILELKEYVFNERKEIIGELATIDSVFDNLKDIKCRIQDLSKEQPNEKSLFWVIKAKMGDPNDMEYRLFSHEDTTTDMDPFT